MSKRNASQTPVERPFRFCVNDRTLVTIMATPELLEELAAGWLWSNDLIETAEEIKGIFCDVKRALIGVEISGEVPQTINRTVSSGCGGGALIADMSAALPKIEGDLKIAQPDLSRLMAEFFERASMYRETGGVHGAAIADRSEVKFVAEDIGRHNAVDKVIGWALLNKVDTSDQLILTTGRVSSEMRIKSARAGFSIVATRTAATDLAVSMAEQAGMTLVGYVRKNDAVVYCHPGRIT